ncbi:MAG TPA: hypothetical protein VG474_13020, partial [Solirubrobacteraceae bacterium]|nr:hypothetical protein [Solirubrobacteraceae bacterium]
MLSPTAAGGVALPPLPAAAACEPGAADVAARLLASAATAPGASAAVAQADVQLPVAADAAAAGPAAARPADAGAESLVGTGIDGGSGIWRPAAVARATQPAPPHEVASSVPPRTAEPPPATSAWSAAGHAAPAVPAGAGRPPDATPAESPARPSAAGSAPASIGPEAPARVPAGDPDPAGPAAPAPQPEPAGPAPPLARDTSGLVIAPRPSHINEEVWRFLVARTHGVDASKIPMMPTREPPRPKAPRRTRIEEGGRLSGSQR